MVSPSGSQLIFRYVFRLSSHMFTNVFPIETSIWKKIFHGYIRYQMVIGNNICPLGLSYMISENGPVQKLIYHHFPICSMVFINYFFPFMFPIYFPIFFLLSSNMFVHDFPVKLPFEKEFFIAMLGNQMVIWNNIRPLFFFYITLKNGLGWSKVSWGGWQYWSGGCCDASICMGACTL